MKLIGSVSVPAPGNGKFSWRSLLLTLLALPVMLAMSLIGQVSIAAATAVAGYDLFRDQKWNISSQPRVLSGISCCGSAAALDTELELFVGNVLVTNVFNSATGAPTRDHVQPLAGIYVPAGERISCIVKTAPGTNPINVNLY